LVDCAHGSSGRPSAHGVRRIIARSCVRSGQTPGLDVSWERIEDHVRMIVGELAAIRRKKRRIGRWSDLPVTPLMFG
ncbi:MAG: hypothetical protein OER86_12475, partial [Phycisphaerae bacterium]|nr:hypothetical protein [Phycisphaerae bacterium]